MRGANSGDYKTKFVSGESSKANLGVVSGDRVYALRIIKTQKTRSMVIAPRDEIQGRSSVSRGFLNAAVTEQTSE
jgi:hypothetical protein